MRIRTRKAYTVYFQAYDNNNGFSYIESVTFISYQQMNQKYYKEQIKKEIEPWNQELKKIISISKVSEIKVNEEEQNQREWQERMLAN